MDVAFDELAPDTTVLDDCCCCAEFGGESPADAPERVVKILFEFGYKFRVLTFVLSFDCCCPDACALVAEAEAEAAVAAAAAAEADATVSILGDSADPEPVEWPSTVASAFDMITSPGVLVDAIVTGPETELEWSPGDASSEDAASVDNRGLAMRPAAAAANGSIGPPSALCVTREKLKGEEIKTNQIVRDDCQ